MRMSLRALGAIVLSVLSISAHAGTVTWTGGGDGTTWSQAANWSSNPALPGASDDVVIGPGGTAITGNANVTIKSLDLGRNMNMSGSLNFASGTGLTLSNGAVVTLSNVVCAFVGGTQSISGTGTIQPGINAQGYIDAVEGCALTIGAGITLRTNTGVGSYSYLHLRMGQQGVAPNTNASIVSNAQIIGDGASRDFYLANNTGGTSAPTFVNNGATTIANGAILNIAAGIGFTNAGGITLTGTTGAATINNAGRVSSFGTITRSGNSVVNFSGQIPDASTFNLAAASGPVNFTGGTFKNVTFASPDATLYAFGNIAMDGCTLAAPAGVGGIINITNGLTVNSAIKLNSQLSFNGGTQTLGGTGSITTDANNQGFFDAQNGCQLTIASTLTIRTNNAVSGYSYLHFRMFQRTNPSVLDASITVNCPLLADGSSRSIYINNVNGVDANGTFTSNALVSIVNGADLNVQNNATFVNNGGIAMNGPNASSTSTLNLVARMSSLGTITRTGQTTVNFSGVIPDNSTFTINNASGPVTINNGTFKGVTFASPDSTAYTFAAGSYNGCVFSAVSNVTGSLSVTNSLTVNNTMTLGSVLSFDGGTQSLLGTGNIVTPMNGYGYIDAAKGCQLTIASGLSLRTTTAPTGTSYLYLRAFVKTTDPIAQAKITINATMLADGISRAIYISNPNGVGSSPSVTTNALVTASNGATFDVGSYVNYTNAGGIALSGTGVNGNTGTYTNAGNITALGAITRTGTTNVDLSGSIASGSTLTISAATGPVGISGGSYTNVTFTSSDSTPYTFTAGTFNACVLSAPTIVNSGGITVNNGLTVNGPMTLNYVLSFNGGTQTLGGTGTITAGASANGYIDAANGCQLTIANTLTLRTAPAGAGSTSFYFRLFRKTSAPIADASITCNAPVIADGANRTLYVSNSNSGLPTFTSNGAMSVLNGAKLTVETDVLYTNAGGITLGNASAVNHNGRLSSLGTYTRSGTNSINLGGTIVPGTTLTLSSLTGDVNINAGTHANVTFNAQPGYAYAFSDVALSACTINAPSALTSTVTVTNGITINNTMTSSYVLSFDGGVQTLAGTGTYMANKNATAYLDATNGCQLTIASTFTVRTTDQPTPGSSTMYVRLLRRTTPSILDASITNQGTFIADGTGRTIQINNSNGLPATPSFISTGTISIANNAVLGVDSGTLFNNTGSLSLTSAATFNFGGRLLNLGNLTRSGGSIFNFTGTLADGANFTLSNATGAVNFGGQNTFKNVTFNAIDGLASTFTGGTYDGCTFNGPVVINTGGITILNGLTVNGNITLNYVMSFSGGAQTLGGTGSITVGVNNQGYIDAIEGCQLTIGTGLRLATAAAAPSTSSTLYFRMGQRVTPPVTDASILCGGKITIDGASRQFYHSFYNGQATGSIAYANELNVTNGAVMTIYGGINIVNSGAMRLGPGANVNISDRGTLTQTSLGSLIVDIAGLATDTSKYGKIIPSPGSATSPGGLYTAGGNVTVNFINGFNPTGCLAAYKFVERSPNAPVTSVAGLFASATVPPPPSPSFRSAVGFLPGIIYFARSTKADLTDQNGSGEPDGRVTPSDLVFFFNQFFAGCAPGAPSPCNAADVTDNAGNGSPDGQLTASDVVAYFSTFFVGCQ